VERGCGEAQPQRPRSKATLRLVRWTQPRSGKPRIAADQSDEPEDSVKGFCRAAVSFIAHTVVHYIHHEDEV
jgi:hypothetical protein